MTRGNHDPSATHRRPTTAAPGNTAGSRPAPVEDDAPVPPGRPVSLAPTPPGFWPTLLGAVGALLAPFFGILIGSGLSSDARLAGMSPLYWGFFLGSLIGALALVMAGLGAARLWRHHRARGAEEDR